MNEPALKEPKLNPKEHLFLKYYLDVKNKETFGNSTLCAMKVWPNQKYFSAAVTASGILKKTKIFLISLMEAKGLSQGKLIDKLNEWIDAKKISTSLTEPDKITNDWQTQLKAGELIIKLMGLDKQILNQMNLQVDVQPILGSMRADGDCDYVDSIKDLRKEYGFDNQVETNKETIVEGEITKEEAKEETKEETKEAPKEVLKVEEEEEEEEVPSYNEVDPRSIV